MSVPPKKTASQSGEDRRRFLGLMRKGEPTRMRRRAARTRKARKGSQAVGQSFAVAGRTNGAGNYRSRGVHALHLGLTESHALCTTASYALLE